VALFAHFKFRLLGCTITFSIMTLIIMKLSSTMTLNIEGLFVTYSINDTQHDNTLKSAIMLSVTFFLL
jgi:hypothetical protein